MIRSFVIILISGMTISCASFSHKRIKHIKNESWKLKLSQLEGSYDLEFISNYSYDGVKDSIDFSIVKSRLERYFKLQDSWFDSIAKYQLDLKVKNEQTLTFVLKKNDEAIDKSHIEGKFKNGFFYLKEKNVECIGIPYIIGGCTSDKMRIGLSKEGGLLLNIAYDSSGAILLFLGAGRSYNSVYVIENATQ